MKHWQEWGLVIQLYIRVVLHFVSDTSEQYFNQSSASANISVIRSSLMKSKGIKSQNKTKQNKTKNQKQKRKVKKKFSFICHVMWLLRAASTCCCQSTVSAYVTINQLHHRIECFHLSQRLWRSGHKSRIFHIIGWLLVATSGILHGDANYAPMRQSIIN